MMGPLLNQMRAAAQEAMADRAVTRHGTIAGYDPSAYAVKVALQPDGTLTDWLPLATLWAGNGWGCYFAPAIGVACEVNFQEDDPSVGTVGGFFFNDEEVPLSVPSGEFWLVHQTGTSIKLTNDGAVAIATTGGASVSLMGGSITSAGSWIHSGTFEANGIGLTTHVHTGVATGTGESEGPMG